MKTYEIVDSHKYDPSKKNILLFLLERNLSSKTNMLSYNYILNTAKILKKDFNVFLIARSSSSRGVWIDAAKEHEVLKDCIYINLDSTGKFMRVETGEKELYNDDKAAFKHTFDYMDNLFSNCIDGEPWIFDNLVGTLTSALFLVYERNHEIIPYDERTQKLLDGARRTAVNRLTGNQQFFSFRMISQRNMYPLYLLVRLMKERPELWHYSFCHDTSSIWYPFSTKVNPLTKNVRCFYFVDDKRGMRDFSEFPSGPIQDAYGKRETSQHDLEWMLKNKKRDFIFGGTFPYDVGYRLNDWKRFFQSLECDALVRTQTDGTSTITESEIQDPLETKKFKNKKIKDEAALDVIKSIYNSPIVKPTVPQSQYLKEQQDFLYTIILKCFYGKYDSLNFRIYSSLVHGIIPLIANDYDIDDLQIPNFFKEYLTVSNNEDIEERVKWAKENPEEYRALFFELYNYYVKPEHFNTDWYEQVFREKYFAEIYNK
ncbi:MAG TPA: hypothetical protein VK190_04650 [Pseudoneobacillus sp.]|nr:hypothetical protein [Pseudoneobacillus sp.]